MIRTLDLLNPKMTLDREMYELTDLGEAHRIADATGGVIYTWETSGRWNLLHRGAHLIDALGLVVLPDGPPEFIEMPDYLGEDGDEEESVGQRQDSREGTGHEAT